MSYYSITFIKGQNQKYPCYAWASFQNKQSNNQEPNLMS